MSITKKPENLHNSKQILNFHNSISNQWVHSKEKFLKIDQLGHAECRYV